jgi:hypothetical protein
MKALGIFAIVLLTSAALFAQNRSGFVNSGNVIRTGSSVVFPAGTSAAPGVQRTAGSVVYPAGGGPQIGIPSAITNLNFPGHFGAGRPSAAARGARTGSYVYAYPVYVGGGGYGGYYDSSYAGQPPVSSGQDQPNVVVVYPPQQPPVIINQFGSGDGQLTTRVQPQSIYPMQPAAAHAEETPEATHYLIAFKDHSIYSAVAYWVDGDTLHYFTTGSTHNQASVSLVDRELTDRLNREAGLEVKLPPAK